MGNSVDKEKYSKPFSGEEPSDVTIEYFITYTEIISNISQCSEEETAFNAIKLLTGKAMTWLENLRMESPETALQWSKLKPKLIARFANESGAVGGSAINEYNIRHFTGEENTDYPVGRFINSVDQLSTSLKLDSSQTSIVAVAFTAGIAATWVNNLIQESPEIKKDWPRLKEKLQGRFGKILSLTERVRILQGLNQKGKESSEDFYDRVSAKLYSVEQEVLNSAEGELERKAMIRMHQLFTTLLFTNGLESEVKTPFLKMAITTQKAELPTVDEIRSSVKNIDDSIKKKRKEAAAQITTTTITKPTTMPPTAATVMANAALAKGETITLGRSILLESLRKAENKPETKPGKKPENKGANTKPKLDSKSGKEDRKRRDKSGQRPQVGGLMPTPLMSMNPHMGPTGAGHFSPLPPAYTDPGHFHRDAPGEFRGERDYRGERNFRGSHDNRGRGRGHEHRPRGGLSANIHVNLQHPGQTGGYMAPVVYPVQGQGQYLVYRDGLLPPGYVNPQPPPYDDRF